ncbi:hypothetical protein FA13DRAFT_1714393 [Coprinellus micaceus]|uniref:Uncharacterized protein n=1 Tax=Coprinellus micaceus TaxID=71717 RepID=A0A4Y7SS98_COPMI|nr:hypothetical protein FA13DRAFT_1714393 [Coprinellus micaceus]
MDGTKLAHGQPRKGLNGEGVDRDEEEGFRSDSLGEVEAVTQGYLSGVAMNCELKAEKVLWGNQAAGGRGVEELILRIIFQRWFGERSRSQEPGVCLGGVSYLFRRYIGIFKNGSPAPKLLSDADLHTPGRRQPYIGSAFALIESPTQAPNSVPRLCVAGLSQLRRRSVVHTPANTTSSSLSLAWGPTHLGITDRNRPPAPQTPFLLGFAHARVSFAVLPPTLCWVRVCFDPIPHPKLLVPSSPFHRSDTNGCSVAASLTKRSLALKGCQDIGRLFSHNLVPIEIPALVLVFRPSSIRHLHLEGHSQQYTFVDDEQFA